MANQNAVLDLANLNAFVDALDLKQWLETDIERIKESGTEGEIQVEFALVDVRERGVQAEDGHIIHSVPLPYGELEILAPRLLPRLSVAIVVVDGEGGSLARRAAHRLRLLGYKKVAVLAGGTQGWADGGLPLYTGVSAYTKAFGEWVEHIYRTPSISANELAQKLQAKEPVVLVDGRSRSEFIQFSIPGAVSVPNAELPYRIHSLLKDEQTLVVVNCAGRTRSIIGAQALINSGIRNPVVALRNGTMDWLKFGYELQSDIYVAADDPDDRALAKIKSSVYHLSQQFGLEWIEHSRFLRLKEESHLRTLYVFDVRTEQEFIEGHLPGAIWAEGGELVQWLDRHVAVRNARIVLVDDEDGARAAITASWLTQLNVAEIYLLRTTQAQRRESGRTNVAASQPVVPLLSPAEVHATLAEWLVFDVGTSHEYRAGHIPGALFLQRAGIDVGAIKAELQGRRLALTSNDGLRAAWVADELKEAFPDVAVIAGGNTAWAKYGFALEQASDDALKQVRDVPPWPYAEKDRQKAFDEYLAWEIRLLDEVSADPSVQYRVPEFLKPTNSMVA